MQWLTLGEWNCPFDKDPKLPVGKLNGRYKKVWQSSINIYQPVGYCNRFMRHMEDN